MLYSFAKILMRTGLRFFFRHVYVTGMEHIPKGGPVIIIANHPSSLMDAALLGVLLKRPAYFFTRGDVFINKPVQKILSWFHMIPVHQHQKGRSSIGANDNSFTEAQQILSGNGIIVFFPESTSHVEHQLWPFRKGVFRLAFQTMAAHKFLLNIPIVPVGITYDHPSAGRRCVQLHAGPALQSAGYAALYQSNPAAALLHIVKDTQNSMTEQVLHVLRSERCAVAEQSILINNNNQPKPPAGWKAVSRQKLEQGQAICHYINRASEPELAEIKKKKAIYFGALDGYSLEDKTVSPYFSFSHRDMLLLWIGFPIYVIGIIFNGAPMQAARYIANKKVRRVDFYSWIFVVGYTLLYFFYLLLLTAAVCYFAGWYGAGIMIVIILAGLFSFKYNGLRQAARQYRKLRRLSAQEIIELKKLRSEANVLSS